MLKTISLSFAALFFVCLLGCHPSSNSNYQNKEFEGIIKYKTKYYSWQDSSKGDFVHDTLTIYYSHGNLAKIHTDAAMHKEIFLSKGNKYFYIRSNIDTLFWFDITTNPKMELSDMQVKNYDKTILGHKCESVDLLIKHPDKDLPFYTTVSYIFSRNNLRVEKANLNWNKYAFFDKFIDESGCFYLGYKYAAHSTTGFKVLLSTEYEAISIKEQKVDPKVFELDKFPLKELKL